MSSDFWQIVSSVAVVFGVVLSGLGGFGQFYFGKKAEQEHEAAQIALKQLDAQAAVVAANHAEQLRRRQILAQLRALYLLSHDGISPELAAGVAPLPKSWTEQKLQERGEAWRQGAYY